MSQPSLSGTSSAQLSVAPPPASSSAPDHAGAIGSQPSRSVCLMAARAESFSLSLVRPTDSSSMARSATRITVLSPCRTTATARQAKTISSRTEPRSFRSGEAGPSPRGDRLLWAHGTHRPTLPVVVMHRGLPRPDGAARSSSTTLSIAASCGKTERGSDDTLSDQIGEVATYAHPFQHGLVVDEQRRREDSRARGRAWSPATHEVGAGDLPLHNDGGRIELRRHEKDHTRGAGFEKGTAGGKRAPAPACQTHVALKTGEVPP